MTLWRIPHARLTMRAAQPMDGSFARRSAWLLLGAAAYWLAQWGAAAAGCSARLSQPTVHDALLLLLVGPVLEEYVLRAGLQAALSHVLAKRRPLIGSALTIIACALVFALLHLQHGASAALALSAPAVAIGVLYQMTGSWRACACLHIGFNWLAWFACSGSA